MKLRFLILMTLVVQASFAQTDDNNCVFWSSSKKLTVDDFGIKTKDNETLTSFAQFSIDWKVNGFDFMTKNFNDKVRHYIIRSASSIDTTVNVAASLRYQQTLFDLCEIYTRHFRKQMKENRKKLISGTQFFDQLNQQAMTDFANRRILYDRETNYGLIEEKQREWEIQIRKELEELNKFSNE